MASVSLTPNLSRTLNAVRQRLRLRFALRFGANGVLVGAAVSLIALILLRLQILNEDIFEPLLLIAPPLIGAILGAIVSLLIPMPALDVARLTEQNLDLKERFSTALLLAPKLTEGETSLRTEQVADAEARANGLDLKKAIPLTPLPRRVWASAVACLAVGLAWFLPTLPAFMTPQQRAEQQQVKREGERLVRIAKALEKNGDGKKLTQAKKNAAKIAALGKKLQQGRTTKKKALMQVAKLSDEIKAQQQSLADKSGESQKSLAEAGRELEKSAASAQKGDKDSGGKSDENKLNAPGTQEQSGNGQKSKNGQQTPGQEALQKAAQALSKNDTPSLAEQLSKLADKAAKGEPRTEAERQDMAQSLDKLADSLEKTSLSSVSEPLKEAADAMKKGDMKTAEQKLREAARRAQEAGEKSAEAKKMLEAAEALTGGQDEMTAEGDTSDSGEGEGDGDAFDQNGKRKGKGKGQGGTKMVNGVLCENPNGKGDSGNGIGSGAGEPGGKEKPKTKKATPYVDAGKKSASKDVLGRKTQTKEVRDDDFVRLYAPGGKDNATRLKGQRGDKGKETVSYFKGAPGRKDASVPYYEVYGQYAPAAESAMNREDIPANYKKQVKDYFDSLRPEKEKGK